MGMSIGGINTYRQIEPMRYVLSNQSKVSDAYSREATKGTKGVNAAPPVHYATARETMQIGRLDATARQTKGQQASRRYNEMISGFGGSATGYGRDRMASSYEMYGRAIDVYV